MREDIDRERLRVFLDALGRTFRRPARLYLTAGEGMVWRGLRESTRDIDVAYDVALEHHDAWIRAIVELKERLNVNVEEASPGDFVPLPPGSADRAEFIGRFGEVDVFLFDPYSIALSKLDRASSRDVADVRALLDAGVISATRLRELVEAAITGDKRRRAKFDPARVRRNLDALLVE
ncbi:MAG: hypothetical protein K8T90_07125 [Planctomycetes bacterium]|nr:hypothetical protein [Planctomycetota bacterium]